MGKRSRRKRSLLGRRDSRSRTGTGGAETPVEADEAEEVPPEPGAGGAPEPVADGAPTSESEVASAPEPEPEPEPEPLKREPFVPPPHWPAPRFVSRRRMMRGHVRPPTDEPLLSERELHLALGLAAMAFGFVLFGGFGLVGLYLFLGGELFRALGEFFFVAGTTR